MKRQNPVSYAGRKATQNRSGDARFATNAQAVSGVADDLIISPASLAASVDDLVPDASQTQKGVVELSTSGEMTTGTSETLVPAVKVIKDYVDGVAIAGAPAWSESVSGIGQLATSAEAVALTDDTVAMTPLKVADVLAAPAAIGSGTPAAGSFTTLGATGAVDFDAGGSFESGGAAIDIGADASADAINVGTGAAARTITVGNVTGATALAFNAGTGGIALASTGSGDITLNSDDTLLLDADGVLELNSSAGIIGIGNDADAFAINIGTGAAARTITMGNGTGATSLVLDCGTGALNIGTNAIAHSVTIGNVTGATALALNAGTGGIALASTGTGDITINSDDTLLLDADGVLELNSSAGAIGIGNDADAQAINIGTGAAARVITVGNVTGASQVVINSGTAGVAINTTGAGDVVVTSADTVLVDAAGVLELNSSAGVISIGNDAVAQNMNIGTGAAARTITIGNVTGATALALNAGTGGIALVSTGAGDITLDSDDTLLLDADGVLELNSSAGVISIGNDADANNINIGTGAAARTITVGNGTGATSLVLDCGTGALNVGTNAVARAVSVGNATGASSLTLAAGTGRITVTGTVKEIDAEFLYSSGTDLVVTQSPMMQSAATTGAAPTGVSGDVNLMYMQDGCLMEQFIIGTQTIIAPRMSANGLAIELDNTNAEGAEYNFGARNNAKHAFTIGTDAAFFLEAKFQVADLSGCAPLMVGFRKVEANNATLANYTDYFCAGLNSATSATNVVLLDELNSGGQTATDSTDAWGSGDGTSATIKVLVSASGVCTYTIDGGAPSATNAMTFDTADVVMPFIHFLNGADVAGEVALISFKCGYQA